MINKDNEKNRLKDIKKRIISAAEIRNIIAHANWMTATKDHYVRTDIMSDSDAGHIKFKYYKLSPKILRDLDAKLSKLVSEFDDFLNANQLA